MGKLRNTALASGTVVIRCRCSPTLTQRVNGTCTQYEKLVLRQASHTLLVTGGYMSDRAALILKWLFSDMVITALAIVVVVV